MDNYLATLGLWRKPTAQDKTCLYRAVSEQLFHTQAHYQCLKKVCDDYIERNKAKLDEVCKGHGQLDIVALSKVFRRTFIVYKEPWKSPVIINEGCSDKVVLCFSGGHHYDSVYPRSYIESAAICQSIVYEVLYQNVFGLEAPLEMSNEMINNKPNKLKADVTVSTSTINISNKISLKGIERSEETDNSSKVQDKPIHRLVPFPYKVAKALAADIYRNVELDVWIEANKEQAVKGGHANDGEPALNPGDKCRVTLEGRTFIAHIQEIEPEHGPTTVFIEELGEKHIVPITSLRPLSQSDKLRGWNHNEDVQNLHKKQRNKNNLGDHCSMATTTEQEKGSTSPLAFRANVKPKFGSVHVINSAGHLIKNNRVHPQRIRSYSDSGTPSNTDSSSGDTTHSHGADNVTEPRKLAFTPPPPRPQSYGNACSAYSPLPSVVNQVRHSVPVQIIPTVAMAQSGSQPIPQPESQAVPQPAPHPAIQPQMIAAAAAPPPPQPPPPPPHSRQPSSAHTQQPSPQTYSMNGAGQLTDQVPFTIGPPPPHVPYLPVPYTETITGPVNYRAMPSSDPLGADLPIHDPSTLRFFFNLGVAYYQFFVYVTNQSVVASSQQGAAPAMYPYSDVTYSMPAANQRHAMESDYSGQCHIGKPLVKDEHTEKKSESCSGAPTCNANHVTNVSTVACAIQKQCKFSHKTDAKADGLVQVTSGIDQMAFEGPEAGSHEPGAEHGSSTENKHNVSTESCECAAEGCDKHEQHDSGCVSDASSGNGEMPLHQAGTEQPAGQPVNEQCDAEASSQHSHEVYAEEEEDLLELLRQPIFTRPPRQPRQPRQRGSTPKLVRPIKDIPPRFKKLLEAEAIAQAAALRKNQYEGAPLVRQFMMGRGRRHKNAENQAKFLQPGFNPNAQCFIPGQPYQCSYDQSNGGLGYVSYNVGTADGGGAGGGSSSGGARGGGGSVDGSTVASNNPTYTMHVVDGTASSICSSSDGYYCECPSNSVCVSSTGTYYF